MAFIISSDALVHGDFGNVNNPSYNMDSNLILSPISSFSSPHPTSGQSDMARDKEKPRLEIILDSERLFLKGTGVDMEPALLSGHVALYLTNPMSVKEITLQFRGKARLPVTSSEPYVPLTLLILNHLYLPPTVQPEPKPHDLRHLRARMVVPRR
jgi:hypothetical protein